MSETPSPQLPRALLISRHSLITRVTHWINLLCIILLLMSGLQIFNAHPALYRGHSGANPSQALFEVGAHGPKRNPQGSLGLVHQPLTRQGFLGFRAMPMARKWCVDFRDG
jgi:Prokaryotic cytochrome b561